jgi:hypothetical protein
MSLLSLANLTQHVSFQTHHHLHTLDLVITTADSLLSPVVWVVPNLRVQLCLWTGITVTMALKALVLAGWVQLLKAYMSSINSNA